MSIDSLQFNQALPDDVVVGGSSRIIAYRNYPVFSLPWLKKRSLLFAIVIGLFALPVAVGFSVMTQKIELGLLTGGHFFLAFMVMATAGPAFATWVRHRRYKISTERRAVVFAVLLGIIASYFADQWSSGYMQRTTEPYLGNQTVNINSKGGEEIPGNINVGKVTGHPGHQESRTCAMGRCDKSCVSGHGLWRTRWRSGFALVFQRTKTCGRKPPQA